MLPRSAEIQPLFLRFVTLSWPPAAPGWAGQLGAGEDVEGTQVLVGKARGWAPSRPPLPNFAAIEVWAPNGRAGLPGQRGTWPTPAGPDGPNVQWTDLCPATPGWAAAPDLVPCQPLPLPGAPTLECPPRTREFGQGGAWADPGAPPGDGTRPPTGSQ